MMQGTLRVGIAGLGTVGASVVRRLQQQHDTLRRRTGKDIVVTGLSARSRRSDRGFENGAARWFDDPVALACSAEIDLFVELIGGQDGIAKEAVEAALGAGKPVVTANKALLAHHGMDLARRAERAGTTLAFEASVAGGIPIVKTLREGLAGNQVERVEGILNGTCNYILTRMLKEGLTFAACLAEAQRLGYAEADPTFDVDGFDTAHKLTILSTLAFGVALDPAALHVEGIRAITPGDLAAADELGYRIKLLGIAERTASGAIDGRVHPTMVPKGSAIAQVDGVVNAVTVFADAVRELTLIGPGAGGEATASAVVADIADVARGVRSAPLGLPVELLERGVPLPVEQATGAFYMRLSVQDRPGAVATIAARMAERGISFESIMQRHASPSAAPPTATVPVILVTYDTAEAHLRAALRAIAADGCIAETPQVIRIDRR